MFFAVELHASGVYVSLPAHGLFKPSKHLIRTSKIALHGENVSCWCAKVESCCDNPSSCGDEEAPCRLLVARRELLEDLATVLRETVDVGGDSGSSSGHGNLVRSRTEVHGDRDTGTGRPLILAGSVLEDAEPGSVGARPPTCPNATATGSGSPRNPPTSRAARGHYREPASTEPAASPYAGDETGETVAPQDFSVTPLGSRAPYSRGVAAENPILRSIHATRTHRSPA